MPKYTEGLDHTVREEVVSNLLTQIRVQCDASRVYPVNLSSTTLVASADPKWQS